MLRKKTFKKIVGNYFFNVKMGYQNNILISRKSKAEAEYAYSTYVKQKKECEWLGKWDGDKFVEKSLSSSAA